MADLSDVTDALVQMVDAVLYPNGSDQPSITGTNIRIYPGWPVPAQLSADLAVTVNGEPAPIMHVSVYPRPEERNMTRFADDWCDRTDNEKLLTLTVSGQTVTVLGRIPPAENPHHVMVMVSGKPYAYLVQPTDTLADIAANLAREVRADWAAASSADNVFTAPPPAIITAARVGVTQTSTNEVRRQERLFQIVTWAATPNGRTAVAKPLDAFLAATKRFVLPDDTWAKLTYKGSPLTDAAQNQQVYRRDLLYTVEFGTLESVTASEITQFGVDASVQRNGVAQHLSTTYS